MKDKKIHLIQRIFIDIIVDVHYGKKYKLNYMKNLNYHCSYFIFLFLLFSTNHIFAQDNDTFKDERDGKIYKIVKIGEQIWFAENLNYESKNSWCYDNKSDYCSKYGRLYTWDNAKDACPKGWHVPNLKEWQQLISYLGGDFVAGGLLLSGGDSKFNAICGGLRGTGGKFDKIHELGVFWTSTELEDMIDIAWMYVVNLRTVEVYSSNTMKSDAFSIRCIKDKE